MPSFATLKTELNHRIISCSRCPRLRQHCETVAIEKRRAYRESTYWGKPVPHFGSLTARLLVVGLAPAAHGANRTGRMFTGDRSGDWLYRALFQTGFASQAVSHGIRDGLKLRDCLVTAAVHCAPPKNSPSRAETKACAPHLHRLLDSMNPLVIVALGGFAWGCVLDQLKQLNMAVRPKPKFGHAVEFRLTEGPLLIGSYHPSQQNTFTGRLTEVMLRKVFQIARREISGRHRRLSPIHLRSA